MFEHFLAELLVFGGVFPAVGGKFDQLFGVILHVDATGVQHHQAGVDAHGGVEGLEGVFKGAFPFAAILGGEFVHIGRGAIDAHGQGTEVVQTANLHLPGGHGFENARQQTDADAVTQFCVSEAQVANLAQHGASPR